MTRKDFNLIALVMREHIAHTDADHAAHVEYVARDLATALATTNHLFDRARFLKACGC